MWERHRWAFFNGDSRKTLCGIQSVWRAGETIMEILIVRESEPGICLCIVRIKFYRARHECDELVEYLRGPFAITTPVSHNTDGADTGPGF